jgi:hypothetical protein
VNLIRVRLVDLRYLALVFFLFPLPHEIAEISDYSRVLYRKVDDILGLVSNNLFRVVLDDDGEVLWDVNLLCAVDSLLPHVAHLEV